MGYIIGFGAAVLLWVVLVQARILPFDRRARLARGRFDLPLSSGNCAAACPVTVHVSPDAAGGLVVAALEGLNVKDVVTLDSWTMAGWTGLTWRSFGQQVGVVMQPNGTDEVILWCCSRPRLATVMIDWGASTRSAGSVAAAISRLAGA